MSQWQPIETAPKDGTEVLLTGTVDFDSGDYPEDIAADMENARPIVIGQYCKSSGFTIWEDVDVSDDRRVQTRKKWESERWSPDWLEPTHWMPLPEPPA